MYLLELRLKSSLTQPQNLDQREKIVQVVIKETLAICLVDVELNTKVVKIVIQDIESYDSTCSLA